MLFDLLSILFVLQKAEAGVGVFVCKTLLVYQHGEVLVGELEYDPSLVTSDPG